MLKSVRLCTPAELVARIGLGDRLVTGDRAAVGSSRCPFSFKALSANPRCAPARASIVAISHFRTRWSPCADTNAQ